MKHINRLLILTSIITLCACGNDSNKNNDDKLGDNIEVASTECTAPASWFAMVNGTRKTPAPNEGSTSPFANNATVSNCDFHQWSWQKFLWLTNETNGVPFFENNLLQVSADGKKLSQSNGIVLTEIAQASSTTDILKTNADFNVGKNTDTVYYSIHMNDLLYGTMIKYGPIAKNDPTKVKDVTFPVGALEVKISWVNVNSLADTTSYYITQGEINGKSVRVALLGMHVVGVVENHPEFIWATFEHENLAPSYDWSKATPTTDAPVTSSKDYLFFNKNATSTVANITSGNGIYTNIFSVYKYGVPVQKEMKGSHNVQVFMSTSQNGFENYNNIQTINESVKKQLTGTWNNYFYNGSLWINTEGFDGTAAQAAELDKLSYNLSSSDTGDLTRGSVALYNITMESYVQVGFPPVKSINSNNVGNIVNCFSCHNTSSKNNLSPLFISHVFTGYVNNLNGLTHKQNKQQHVDEIHRQFVLRQSANK